MCVCVCVMNFCLFACSFERLGERLWWASGSVSGCTRSLLNRWSGFLRATTHVHMQDISAESNINATFSGPFSDVLSGAICKQSTALSHTALVQHRFKCRGQFFMDMNQTHMLVQCAQCIGLHHDRLRNEEIWYIDYNQVIPTP